MSKEASKEKISVFISYAREDIEFAGILRDSLVEQDMTVWMDISELKPLEIWHKEIQNAIIAHDYFLYIASKNSTNPDCYCLQEIKFAKANNKVIIPINVDPSLDWLPEEIKDINWINFSAMSFIKDDKTIGMHIESEEYNRTFNKLLTTINTDLDWVKIFTNLLQKSWEWEGHNKDESYLLFGSELSFFLDAKTKYEKTEPELTKEQEDFLAASVTNQIVQIERQKKINRRQRIMLVFLGILLIVVFISSVIIRQRSIQLLSENLAKSSVTLKDEIDQSLLLSLQANRLSEDAEVQSSLFEGVNRNQYVIRVIRIPTPHVK